MTKSATKHLREIQTVRLTSIEYDESGNKIREVFTRQTAEGTVQDVFRYGYDANGNLIMESKPGGLTTRYTYDFMSRKASETYSDGTQITYTYDKASNLLAKTGPEGTIYYVLMITTSSSEQRIRTAIRLNISMMRTVMLKSELD